ncbi:MAG: EAL domain-containing protein [Giesbergeria sp.]
MSLPPDSWQELEQLRAAVERAEQAEKLQRALFAIASAADEDVPLLKMLARVHSIIGELMYAGNFYVALYDKQTDSIDFLYFVDSASTDGPAPGTRIAMGTYEHSLTWNLIRYGKALRGSLEAIARQVPGALRSRGADPIDWMGVPMLEHGEVRGALVVQSYEQEACFSEQDQSLLSFVGSHVLTALQRWQRREDLEQAVLVRTAALDQANRELTLEVRERQRAEHLQRALYRIAELAATAETMQAFYRAIHDIVGELVNVDNFFIAVLCVDGSELAFPYYVDEQNLAHPPRPLGKGVTEYVLRTARPLLADRAALAVLHEQGAIEWRGLVALCWLGVPLMADGKPIGVVAVQSYSQDVRYSERDQELLQFISSQIASSLERRRMTESLHVANAQLEKRVAERTAQLEAQVLERERIELQLKHQVMHDGLTGLPNRAYLFDRLERLLARYRRHPSRRFAVMFMDIDRFKLINDSVGHHVGDAVLQEVSRRLTKQLRDPDFVARLGGDEFAVLIEETSDVDTVVRIARRLMTALAPPVVAAGHELFVSTSIGITLCDPHYPTAEDLLRNADAAMYRAKTNGRQRFELFDEHLHNDALRVLEMENALRIAIQQWQIQPVFQPVVRLGDGEVVGYEALMRWHHPERGVLSPADFMHFAEDNGSIEAIDWQVFEQAFRVFASIPHFQGQLSVNVAPRHFRDPSFGLRMMALIGVAGIDPARVCLEITEGALIEDPQRTSETMQALRAQGVAMALDDFGTGYSSLGYLHRFPLNVLKIDRSFVTPLQESDLEQRTKSEALVRAVLALAGSLGLTVIAEGIETALQKEILMSLGCEIGQGYLLGRPGAPPT